MKVKEVVARVAAEQEHKVYEAPPNQTDERTADTWTISLPKTRIKTLEELVAACKVDIELWEVERFVCNKWEVGMSSKAYTDLFPTEDGRRVPMWQRDSDDTDPIIVPLFQVKAWFKKRRAVEDAKRTIQRLWDQAAQHAPACYIHKKRAKSKSGNVVEHSIVDIHHGAHIWGKETGGEDWDLRKSVPVHKEAFRSLIERSDAYDPEFALLVLGHDRQNADNRRGQTEGGTQQDNDSRYQKVFDISCDLAIWEVETCLDRYGKVVIKIVPGNHDPLAAWHLGKALSFQFKNASNVEIDNDPNPKKYWEYGTNMVLFTHGQNKPRGKLENFGKTMAAEKPSMWGRTRWREAHTGHVHHKSAFEMEGAIIRSLSSLRPPCAWSNEMNFTGSIRAAESFLWNRDLGMIGTAVYSILDKRVE